MDLAQKKCVACESGAKPMSRTDAEAMLGHVKGWSISPDGKSLSKQFIFRNYVQAMNFASHITPIAESEGHHPDLSIGWGRVVVELSTHAIHGLSENDFILAAKIDQL